MVTKLLAMASNLLKPHKPCDATQIEKLHDTDRLCWLLLVKHSVDIQQATQQTQHAQQAIQ